MQFGNETLRLTTRQTYQLHAVLKQDLKTVFSTVIKNMGTTLGACGDVNRNVLAPPVSFCCPHFCLSSLYGAAGIEMIPPLCPLCLQTKFAPDPLYLSSPASLGHLDGRCGTLSVCVT